MYFATFMKGAIHKQHRQLGWEGVKNWSKLSTDSTKNCRHEEGGCQKSGKIADIVYGWSLKSI